MSRAQDESDAPRPAGPVGAGDPPPPPVAKASSGVGPPTPPPAGEAQESDPGSEASADESLGDPSQGAADEPADAGSSAQVEADLDSLLEDTRRERDEYLELAKRTKADFENFRKRMNAEVLAASARGKGELIREVVPVLDDLERALEAAGLDPEGDSPDGLAHGVLLVFRSLRETLTRSGVEALDPKGEKFDPQWHEALSSQPADGAEAGS